MPPTRRKLLQSIPPLAVCLTGCLSTEDMTEGGGETTNIERVDDFYVENFDNQRHCVSVRISDTQNELLTAQVSVEQRTAVRFNSVAPEGRDLTLQFRLGSGPTSEATWTPEDCPDEPALDQDGAVLIRDGGLVFEKNQCDGLRQSVGQLPVVPVADVGMCTSPESL